MSSRHRPRSQSTARGDMNDPKSTELVVPEAEAEQDSGHTIAKGMLAVATCSLYKPPYTGSHAPLNSAQPFRHLTP